METADTTTAQQDNGGAVSMSPPAPCSPRRICGECGQLWLRCVKCGRDLHPHDFAVRYEGTSTGDCMECTFDGGPVADIGAAPKVVEQVKKAWKSES